MCVGGAVDGSRASELLIYQNILLLLVIISHHCNLCICFVELFPLRLRVSGHAVVIEIALLTDASPGRTQILFLKGKWKDGLLSEPIDWLNG